MEIKVFCMGAVQTNCYFVLNQNTNQMFIVDPGDHAYRLAQEVKKMDYEPVAILLTHGHYDHAGAAEELSKLLKIKIYAQEEEQQTLENPSYNLSGHTKGGCCYYLPKENGVFTGDTLFCQSVGRSDFPGGNHRILIGSIQEKLLVLPDDTRAYPGHMDDTTIGEEKKWNPFLR